MTDETRTTKLSTIQNLPTLFPYAGLTVPAIQAQVFKSQDRIDSKGRKIPGNGLGECGAIIRCGRKILIDVERYSGWLRGGAQ